MVIVLTSRGNYAKFKRIIELAEPQLIIGGELLLSDRATPFNLQGREVYFNLRGDKLPIMGRSVGLAITEFCHAYEEIRPDRIMLVGDRFETFAAATAAYICSIPIIHLEGGEVSGTMDNSLRYAISEFATYHFTATNQAGWMLKNRGYRNVYNVGCTSLDVLETEFNGFDELQETSGIGPVIDTKSPYMVVIYHPDTSNYDKIEYEIKELIQAVVMCGMPTFWINANLDAGSGIIGHYLRKLMREQNFIHFFKGLPIEHYGSLLANARCIVGNSSSGIREGAFLGIPNVCVGERQKDRELGRNTAVCQPDYISILNCINFQVTQEYKPDYIYGDGKASERILEILQ